MNPPVSPLVPCLDALLSIDPTIARAPGVELKLAAEAACNCSHCSGSGVILSNLELYCIESGS